MPIFLRPLILFAFLALLIPFSAHAQADSRLALVVGVSQYQTVPSLRNARNDANLIGATLQSLDFGVTTLLDPTEKDLRSALDRFAFEAEVADIAVIYFAGHGIEFGGKNYLIPSDSIATTREQVAQTSISLDEMLDAVNARQLRVVVLDSCRENPFGEGEGLAAPVAARTIEQPQTVEVDTRAADAPAVRGLRGLAKPAPNRGTLVAYAAEAGEVALDGVGANSPFAEALARHLLTEDIEIGLIFRRVRDDVMAQTGNSQVPHTYGSLPGVPFFLRGDRASVNVLQSFERQSAWGRLDLDQESQLRSLADDGNLRALKGLAYMRLNPEEERFDPVEAARLLDQAAQSDDPEAIYELALLYETGVGVDQDVDLAVTMLKQAADLQFADAINDLGFLTFQGAAGLPRDVQKAIGFFGKAAELHHPEAMYNYAALIDDGLVAGLTPQDAAVFLYRALRSGNEEVLQQLSDTPTMFKPETRRALQELLRKNGFYGGAIDADFGPGTRRGLRRAYGLEE